MKTKNEKTPNNDNHASHDKPSYTVTDLLTKISSLIDTCDYELALKFANRALSMDENDVNVLETLGTVELELGMFGESREVGNTIIMFLISNSELNGEIQNFRRAKGKM